LSFSEVSNYQTDANSKYHGLVMGVSQRFSNGLQIQTSYTFAKLLDNASGQYAPETSGASGRVSGDPYNLNSDWGLSSLHVGQNFVANSTYTLPFGSNRSGVLGAIIKGWQINGIFTLSAGTPRSVSVGFDRTHTLGNGFTPRPNLVAGKSTNPVITDDSIKFNDPTSSIKYLDSTAFSLQDEGTFGNLGRNTVIALGVNRLDAGLSKNFPLPFREGMNLQFRSEFFNPLNHANFGPPATNWCSTAPTAANPNSCPRTDFGLISSTRGSSRQIQFGLKLVF
jgi:hypothetical protein